MSDQQLKEFLEHHGVMGMHWGIRNQQNLDRVSRVARGTASRGDKFKVLTRQSGLSLIRGHGLRGAAANNEQKLREQKKLIQSGRAKTRDLLSLHGAALFNTGGSHASKGHASKGSSGKTIDNSLSLTLKERKRLIREGKLSKENAHSGSIRFGRNIALGMLAGGIAGTIIGKGITG